MRKFNLTVLIVFCLLGKNIAVGQIIGKGDILIDPYVGIVPMDNFGKTGFLYTPGDADFVGSPVSLGLNTEILGWKSSFVFNVDYVFIGYKYTRFDHETVYVPETGGYTNVVVQRDYKRTTQKIRLMLGLNHIISQNDKSLAYVHFGIGYKYVYRVQETNGVKSTPTSSIFSLDQAILPITMRLGFGSKYQLSDRTFFSFDLGFGGGSLLRFGLAFRP